MGAAGSAGLMQPRPPPEPGSCRRRHRGVRKAAAGLCQGNWLMLMACYVSQIQVMGRVYTQGNNGQHVVPTPQPPPQTGGNLDHSTAPTYYGQIHMYEQNVEGPEDQAGCQSPATPANTAPGPASARGQPGVQHCGLSAT